MAAPQPAQPGFSMEKTNKEKNQSHYLKTAQIAERFLLCHVAPAQRWLHLGSDCSEKGFFRKPSTGASKNSTQCLCREVGIIVCCSLYRKGRACTDHLGFKQTQYLHLHLPCPRAARTAQEFVCILLSLSPEGDNSAVAPKALWQKGLTQIGTNNGDRCGHGKVGLAPV